jgi:prephenate dehydrogenase
MRLDSMSVSVVGLGLVGGSIARALKRAGVEAVYGIDVDSDVLLIAEADGAIARGYEDPAEPLAESDLVFLCLKPDDLVAFARDNASSFKEGALLTDTAGVRRGLNARVAAVLRKDLRFVGGHPMAGKEDQGYRNSDPDIFRGASYILTPSPSCGRADVEFVAGVARALGCDAVKETDEDTHDRMIAYTSHLPHVAAAAMVLDPLVLEAKGFSGGSFRDATRVARINPGLWTELLLANADEFLPALGRFRAALDSLGSAIESGDRDALYRLLSEARRMNEGKHGTR